jgi:hypothetical protein
MKRLFYRFDGDVIPDVTRDDLIRLVVGMQWQTAVALLYYDALADGDGAWLHRDAGDFANTTPACDIVDEWMGVRK